jgi:hypothetical protein
MFEDGLKDLHREDVKVRDVAEVVAQAMGEPLPAKMLAQGPQG